MSDLMREPSPVTMAVLDACFTMPNSRLVSTIPMGELLRFAKAYAKAYAARIASGSADTEGPAPGQATEGRKAA